MNESISSNTPSLATPSCFKLYGDALEDFLQYFPQPAALKQFSTGKYELSNLLNAKSYGLSHANDLIGLTVHDIEKKRIRQSCPAAGLQCSHQQSAYKR